MISGLSLKYKIAILIFILEAIMMVSVIQFTQSKSYQSSSELISNNESVILELVSHLSKTALITEEYSELQNYVEKLVPQTDASSIILTNLEGRIIVSSNLQILGSQNPNYENTSESIWRISEISNSAGLQGKLAIEFSTSKLIAAYKDSKQFGFSIAIFGMILIASVSLLAGFFITRRLEKVSTTAQKLTKGDFRARTGLRGTDEIGQLGQTFDVMVQQLYELARYDSLTKVPNRAYLSEFLTNFIARLSRHKNYAALLFIDIDNFKDINDSLGHSQGDIVLSIIADRIKKSIRTEDFVARFGGDEFVICLSDLGDTSEEASVYAEVISEKIRSTCSTTINSENQSFQVKVSIGIAILDSQTTAELAIQHADTAMYKSKHTGRNRISFFSEELQKAAEARLSIQRDLKTAIQENQLALFIQPKFNLNQETIGGEILVRWNHPDKGLIYPNAFIPMAEETGLIKELDEWVLKNAIKEYSALNEEQKAKVKNISINISEPLLMSTGFSQQLDQLLKESLVSPETIELEITERLLLNDSSNAVKVMNTLQTIGCTFSIDDFGTGYSSLRYLQQLPLNKLKIDKSFVDRLPHHAGDIAIINTIFDMAENLSLELVAEGVENKEQFDFLASKGCHEFQGYLFSKPVPWDNFIKSL